MRLRKPTAANSLQLVAPFWFDSALWGHLFACCDVILGSVIVALYLADLEMILAR